MKRVVIVVPHGEVNLSSITGTYEILKRADKHWQDLGNHSRLQVQVAGFVQEQLLEDGLFALRPQPLSGIRQADLVIIPSLAHNYIQVMHENNDLVAWIKEQYKLGAEIATICTGVFLLAATGILQGKTCSTHWNTAHAFRQMFPGVRLKTDQLISVEKGIYTNGGAFSFLNLILFLVEKYYDRDVAIYCSKVFQIDFDRQLQSPFTIFHAQKNHGDELIQEAQHYIEENVEEKISFEELSGKLAVSRRNFDRRFVKATGNTPLEYMQRVKMEAAKQYLEKGRKTVSEVMGDVGYADDKAFRELFKKIVGLSPLEYKAKFNKPLRAIA